MTRVIVVTGTDTEVGKTFVTASLCHALRDAGRTVRTLKPVESGVEGAEPGPTEDGVRLARAADQAWPSAALQRLRAPLAPPVAAELEGVTIADDTWADAVARLSAEAEIVFVEAAGGLLSPLSLRFDALSLIEHLDAEVLVVGRDALGTINHTRLVLNELARAGREPLAVVLSAPVAADASTGRNVPALIASSGFSRVTALVRHHDACSASADLGPLLEWIWRASA